MLSQCEQWKRELADGIKAIVASGGTGSGVTHLREHLRTLNLAVHTVKVELERLKSKFNDDVIKRSKVDDDVMSSSKVDDDTTSAEASKSL